MEIRQGSSDGGGGVTSLNTLTGDITLAAGSNITITPVGNTLTIASTGGSGSPGGADTNVQFNNTGSFDGDSGFTYDGAGTANLSVKLQTNAINYNTAINASGIDLSNTFLLDTAGDKSVFWNARALYFNGGVIQSLNWDIGQIYDTSTFISIDWVNRGLYRADGVTLALNWGSSTAYDGSGNPVFNFSGSYTHASTLEVGAGGVYALQFIDSANILTLDTNARKFYAVNGTTQSIDYSDLINTSALLSFGSGTAYFQQYIGSNASGYRVIDPNGQYLYASDGTTNLLDWTNGGTSVANYYFTLGILQGDGSGLTGVTASRANYLYDNVGPTTSIDGIARSILAPNGSTVIIDYTNIFNPAAGLSFFNQAAIFTNSILDIGGAIASIDPNGRILYASDGTTPLVDWTGAVSTAAISFLTATQQIAIPFGILDQSNGTLSISSNNRKLYAIDGTTALVDFTGSAAGAPISFDAGLVRISNVYTLPNVDGLSGQFLGTDAGGNVTWQYVPYLIGYSGASALWGDMSQNGYWRPNVDDKVSSNDQATYFDNSGFHGNGLGLTGVTAANANYLYDTAGTPIISVDGVNRGLYDIDGTTKLVNFYAGSGGGSIRFGGTYNPIFTLSIDDNSGNASINTNDRILYASDGTSVELDWSGAYSATAILSFDSGFPIFNTSIRDTSFVASIEPNSRYLYASDGTSIVVDWSSVFTVPSGPFSVNSSGDVVANSFTGNGSGLTGLKVASLYKNDLATLVIDGERQALLSPIASDMLNWSDTYPHTANLEIGAAGVWIPLSIDNANAISINQTTRILYADDGTTDLFDWSNTGSAANYYFSGGILQGIGSGLTALDPANITGYTTATSDVLHGDSSWGPVDLAAGVTGVLPIANGGTGQATPVVIAASFSQAVVAATTVTVTLPATQANNTYKLNITPTALLSTAAYYVSAKTTTNFTVTYGTALTGTVAFDWALFT